MMPLIRSVCTEMRSGVMSSLMLIRGRSSRAPASVAARAMRSARISTSGPSAGSTSILPLVLTMRTSPLGESGYRRVHSSVARPVRWPIDMSQPASRSADDSSGPNRSRRETAITMEHSPPRLYIRPAGESVQLDGYELRNARLFHRHAIEPIRDLHCLAIMGDHDELRVQLHAAQHLHEPPDVRIVERRVDLVEETERARLVLEHGEHERDRGQR